MNVYQTLLDALPEKHRDISVYAIFTFGLLILEYAIETIGFKFARRCLPKKEVKENAVASEKKARKVGESLWRFCFYSFALTYGFFVVSKQDFYSDASKMWGRVRTDSSGKDFWDMPPIGIELHFYYFIELAFYSGTTLQYVTRASSATDYKDYWVMLIHHSSTIALISSSYYIQVLLMTFYDLI